MSKPIPARSVPSDPVAARTPDEQEGRARAVSIAHPPRRVIVDFTDLLGHLLTGGAISGIPRVIFEFANAASILARSQNIDLQFGFFDQVSGTYVQLRAPQAETAHSRIFDWLLAEPTFRRGYGRTIDLSRLGAKYAGRFFRRRSHLAYAQLRIVGRRMTHRLLQSLRLRPDLTEIKFSPGDVVLMLGSGWTATPMIDHLEPLQRTGTVTCFVLIHDLIPLLNLEGDDSPPSAIFEPWLARVAKMGCRFLTVSDATRSDLLNYFSTNNIAAHPVSVTPLPHEFSTPAPRPMDPEIEALISRRYALFVGPVSGRKNARRLLEAWARVLGRCGPEATPLLVITSRRGADEIYETHIKPIESHVRLLRRPSDFELSELYRHADFTVFPSLHEGWGLPVGESLWHGTPCITSNQSSMPEVGGALCDYVDPKSVDSIADAVELYIRNRQHRDERASAIKRANFRTWKDFARQVLDAALPRG